MKKQLLILMLAGLLMIANATTAWCGGMYYARANDNRGEHIDGTLGTGAGTTDLVFEIDFAYPAALGDAAAGQTQSGFKVHYNNTDQAYWWTARGFNAPGIAVYWELDGSALTPGSSVVPITLAYHDGAAETVIGTGIFPYNYNWHRVKLTLSGTDASVVFDGNEIISGTIPTGTYDLSARNFLISEDQDANGDVLETHTRWDNITINGTVLEDFETITSLAPGAAGAPAWLIYNRNDFWALDAAVDSDATGTSVEPTPTPTPTPTPIPTPIPGAQQVLLLGGRQPDNLDSDRQIFEVLAYQLLYDVTYVNAGTATPADTIGKDILIFSPQVGSAQGPDLAATFADYNLPIIIAKPGIADDFGLSDATGGGGQVNVTTMSLVLDTDILTSGTGWSNGVVNIYKTPATIIWDENPSADATVVATFPPDHEVLYYYEPGDTMVGRTAPNYRGFFYGDVNGFGGGGPETNLTTQSVQVLHNMVELFSPYVAPVNEARSWNIYD